MPSTLPRDFAVRPATLDDLESVLHLITRQNMADYGEPMASANTLRELWRSPDLDTWLVIAPDESLAGYATLQRRERARFYPSVYVATEHRDKSIDAHLLQLAEARAISARGDTARLTLTGRVSERNPAGKQVFERAGYSRTLSFLVMETVMTEPPPAARWAAGMTVRVFIAGQDEQATYLVDEHAAQDKGYHTPLTFEAWARRMNLHKDGFDPTLWFLACSQDEIAGVALNFHSQATGAGWIDHLGVRREWRNKGVGLGLLLHSFGEFYRRGINRVKLSVDSGSLTNAPRLYERAGMRTVQQYHIYKKGT